MSMHPLELAFGRRLAAIRAVRRISLRALAQQSGVSHNAIATVERGQHSISMGKAAALAEALGWSLFDFLGDGPGGPLDEIRDGQPADGGGARG
ncbi:helix-turn-helix domain-containing protein [Actinomadura scrupuli]|uniref:helix-turn-helix domain-containing protein n=1 Tax=Actinomadura scrupuli TaxID=559629 RepID=UPI003D96D24B